ncbi:DUF3800 domain-containing protein [Roseateles toxinivorans]|uniref:Uncharacterized protein DUF3800 n=1 Tax=Roseateles toxinivorans TaxID=270368 RepID=A0A4R6QRH9_9BURK|nr:DUF3800 domain-containing protein [Roseateles toxinivorans]TDP74084.1 uncharacterized protein DUF3800 [Roseateles toxinivorans]
MEMLDVYGDESCTNGHRYLCLGALAIRRALVPLALEQLAAVRQRHNTHGEVKWSKVSGAKLAFYRDYVDVFFEASRQDDMHFRALYVDTHTFDHHRFNGGQAEIGFNKLIYQLLLHKFGRKYGERHGIEVFLDDRTTKHNPEELRPMLNNHLCQFDITSMPFKRIRFKNSKNCDLIQLNDVLLGVIGFKKNLHENKPDCSVHKKALAEHIVRRALENERPHRLNSAQATRFAVWPFQYKKKR